MIDWTVFVNSGSTENQRNVPMHLLFTLQPAAGHPGFLTKPADYGLTDSVAMGTSHKAEPQNLPLLCQRTMIYKNTAQCCRVGVKKSHFKKWQHNENFLESVNAIRLRVR